MSDRRVIDVTTTCDCTKTEAELFIAYADKMSIILGRDVWLPIITILRSEELMRALGMLGKACVGVYESIAAEDRRDIERQELEQHSIRNRLRDREMLRRSRQRSISKKG